MRRLVLFLCYGLACGLFGFMGVCFAAPSSGGELPSFHSVVRSLTEKNAIEREAFIAASVEQLSAAYKQAAAASKDDPNWARRTGSYSAGLWRALDAVHAGAAVTLLFDADRSLRIVVQDRPVLQFSIMPPQPGQRAALERAIIRQYCRTVHCGSAHKTTATPRSARPYAAVALPVVRKKPTGPRAPFTLGQRRLECDIDNVPHRKLYQRACACVHQELQQFLSEVGGVKQSDGIESTDRNFAAVLNRQRWPLLSRYPEIVQAVQQALIEKDTVAADVLRFSVPSRLVYGLHMANQN